MGDEGQGGDDPRIAVLQQYTLKTMKQKNDKWAKVCNSIPSTCNYCCLLYNTMILHAMQVMRPSVLLSYGIDQFFIILSCISPNYIRYSTS